MAAIAATQIRATLEAFSRYFCLRAPELFDQPGPDELRDFRDIARAERAAWYPLKMPLEVDDVRAVYEAAEAVAPHVTRTVMLTLIDDARRSEEELYEDGWITPLPVVQLFRELGFHEDRFLVERCPSLAVDPPAPVAQPQPAAAAPLLPPSPVLPPLRLELPPLTESEKSLCSLWCGLTIPHYYFLKTQRNVLSAELQQLDERCEALRADLEALEKQRAEKRLTLESVAAHLDYAERK